MQLLWGPELLCIYNDAITPIFSTKHPDSMGRPASTVWHEAWQTVGPQLLHVYHHGQAASFHSVLLPLLQNGVLEDRYYTYSYSPIVDTAGTVVGILNIAQDLTDTALAERAEQEMAERLAMAQQLGNIAAWVLDLQTGSLTWDSAGAKVYGRPHSELAHLTDVQQFLYQDDLPTVMKALEAAMTTTGDFNAEFRVCWPDESHHWLLARGHIVTADDGTPVRMLGVNIDVTERRNAEVALRQSEKLAAVGQLASTISHEINNPLEAVTNLLYLAKAETTNPMVETYLSTAEVELRRVSAITNQTLRFHKQQSRPTEITCVDLFTNALLIFQGRINNAGIQVEKRKRAERPVVCLEGEVRQVMNNLIGNAIDAMKGGGRLLVRSAQGTNWKTGEQGLRLTVADTGTGMNKRTLSSIFQAFFTTKGIGGTGLGLWVSHEIVQRHHGRLSVRSSDSPGKSGTVFSLFLPYDNPPLPGTSGPRSVAML